MQAWHRYLGSSGFALSFIAAAVVVGAGGYGQIVEAATYWCGRVGAWPWLYILTAVCFVQAGLFLASAYDKRWTKPYLLTQGLAFLTVLYVLFQLGTRYPATFLLILGLPIAFCVIVSWRVRASTSVFSAIPYAFLFLAASLAIFGGAGQIPLFIRDFVVPTWLVWLLLVLACGTSLAILLPACMSGAVSREKNDAASPVTAESYMPITFLLFPLLRAKLPDEAYDSNMYKATLPFQIADWRTGEVSIVDAFMVGTNFQETLNGLLIILTGDFNPPLITTICYIVMFFIAPIAFTFGREVPPVGRAIAAFAALSAYVVSEAAIVQGTSYQEPLILLFLMAALVRVPLWPAFFVAAAMVKINALFIAPVFLVYHGVLNVRFWLSWRFVLVGSLLAALVIAPQFIRNAAYSGRVLGLNETLAAVTDPVGPRQVMVSGGTRYDEMPRGGIINNGLASACNMFMLKHLCPTTYQGSENAGFHMFPASRSPLFALILCVFLLGSMFRSRKTDVAVIASVTAFIISYIGTLAFVAEARYFIQLSFCFPMMLVLHRQQLEGLLAPFVGSVRSRFGLVAVGVFLTGANLVPGTFTNVGWMCRRDLLAAPRFTSFVGPQTDAQRFIATQVAEYRQRCPARGLPPVILSEHDVLNSPYIGAHRVHHIYTHEMLSRFFAANPQRQERAADAIVVVVSRSPRWIEGRLGSAAQDFRPCFQEGQTQLFCSTRLAPIGNSCAQSLY
jgi:hypothetical protein